MKKAGKIILVIAGAVLTVLGLLFTVVEIRFLFSGESSVFTYPGLKTAKSFFRLLVSLFTLVSGLLPFFLLPKKKEHPAISAFVNVFALAILVVGIVTAINIKASHGATPIYLSLPILLSSIMYFVGAALCFASSQVQKKKNQKEE
jgi:hypothetical protein